MKQTREAAQKDYGEKSIAYLEALTGSATLYISLNDSKSCINYLEKARKLKAPKGKEKNKFIELQLGAERNLAEIYMHNNDFVKAEAVFADNVNNRQAFYPKDHAAIAFVLDPIAQLKLRIGKKKEALILAKEAYRIYAVNDHPKFQDALNTMFECFAALNDQKTFAAFWNSLVLDENDFQMNAFVRKATLESVNALNMAGSVDEKAIYAARLHWMAASICYNTKKWQKQLDCMELCLKKLEEAKSHAKAACVHRTMALAYSNLGNDQECLKRYKTALEKARVSKVKKLIHACEYDLAIQHKYMNNFEAAEKGLKALVEVAGKSEEAGRGASALGILYHQRSRYKEAQLYLKKAIAILPKMHFDRLTAESHLKEVTHENKDTLSNKKGGVFMNLMREYVEKKLPKDLVKELQIIEEDGRLRWNLVPNRKLTESEGEKVYKSISFHQQKFSQEIITASDVSFDDF